MLPAIPQEPALSVVKTAAPGTITRAGEQVTYSFLVRNTGNVPMSGISVADTFTAPQSGSAGVVSCPQATLDVGESMTCTAPAYTVTQADVDAGQINNSATATGTPPLGPPVDSPPSTARVTIPAAPAIDVVKSASVSTFAAAGMSVTYSYVVRNTGNVTLDPVVVTDPMPGLSAIACPQTRLAPGAEETCTASYTTTDADVAAGSARNTATATGTPPSGPPVRRTSTVTIPYSPVADLSIVKRATSTRLVPGRRLTYELTVTNNGPSPAADVRVSDPLPRGLTFVSASRGCTFASGTVTCTLSSLASGRSATFQVVTRVASSVADSVRNTATVESPTRDPNPGNNRDTTTVPSGPETDLQITKTASVDSATVGGQLFYTLIVRNNGPSDATGVTVNDVAPAGLTLLAARGSQGSCTVAAMSLTCNVGRLPAGGTAQVLVSARVDASGELVNTATVDGDQPDPDPGNNRDQTRVTGRNPPPSLPQPADLAIVKTSNRRAVLGAQTITYTLRVTNLGPGIANGVQVLDTPSLPISVVSVRPSAGSCSRTVPIKCELGTLAPGARATVTIVARPMAPGTLRNSASVTGDVPDPNADNNIDGTSAKVQGLLKIKKVASAKAVRAGATVSYRITVTNASAFALRSVKVCDNLPSGLVLVSSAPKAKLAMGRYCWTVRSLGAKKSTAFRIRARVLKGAGGRKVTTATATAPGARGAHSRAATSTAAIRVLAAQRRGGGVTG